MSLSSYVALQVEVDWDADGAYEGGIEDISADVREVSVRRGRAALDDEFAAGEAAVTVDNNDGRYNPLNSTSPLWPYVVPGRPIRIRATYDGSTYDVFAGRASPGELVFDLGATARLSCIDAFDELTRGRTNTALLLGQRVDQVIAAILDDIAWPAGARDLDVATQTLAVFSNHNRTPLNALQLAARQEMEGGLWIGRNGDIVFRNRLYRSSTTPIATLSAIDDLRAELRQEDLVEDVVITYAPVTIGSVDTVIYTGPGNRKLPALEATTWEVAFTGLGAQSPITPVPGTDLVANSDPSGAGVDKTSQITVDAFAATSGGATLTVSNIDSSPVYLTTEQVRGRAITSGEARVTVAVPAPLVPGQRLQRTLEFIESRAVAQSWASWLAATRGTWQPRVTVEVVPDTDALMAVVLGADLWDRVRISDTGAPWQSQLTGDYIIEAIELDFVTPRLVRARWTMFAEDLSVGTMFRISGAAGAGQDYSTIVAAGGRGHRIGF